MLFNEVCSKFIDSPSSQQYIRSLSVAIFTACSSMKCPICYYVMRICASGLPLLKYRNELIENRCMDI